MCSESGAGIVFKPGPSSAPTNVGKKKRKSFDADQCELFLREVYLETICNLLKIPFDVSGMVRLS